MLSLGLRDPKAWKSAAIHALASGTTTTDHAASAENRQRTDKRVRIDAWIGRILLLQIVVLIVGLLIAPRPAEARPDWQTAQATWYGPGFYGNAFACSHRRDVPDHYSRNVRGVAHMTLPCGTRVTICRRSTCVQVRVIDRGAFHAGNLDLTARTAMDLCRCWQPYTQTVRWARGWTTNSERTTT